MDIKTFDEVKVGETIEIPWRDGYAAAEVTKISTTNTMVASTVKVGLLSYGYDLDRGTEVLVLDGAR